MVRLITGTQHPCPTRVRLTAAPFARCSLLAIAVLGVSCTDSWVDVFVTNYGPDRLYRNQQDGSFADITVAAGAKVDGWSASAAFCDFDRDGFLDLYITRYVDYLPTRRCSGKDGAPDFCGPKCSGIVNLAT